MTILCNLQQIVHLRLVFEYICECVCVCVYLRIGPDDDAAAAPDAVPEKSVRPKCSLI